jgi:hypothetical protein
MIEVRVFSLFRPNSVAISADADIYMDKFGDAAYCCSQLQERRAFSSGDHESGEHFSRIRMEIARKLDYRPILDITEQEILELLGARRCARRLDKNFAA